MRPRRHLCALFALFTLFALPATATAGPINFSYHATGSVFLFPGQLDPGPVNLFLDAGGNVNWHERGGRIELGSVRFGTSPGPQGTDSYTASTPFEVSVVVTDQLTGESATLVLPGGALDMWDYRSWDGRWTNPLHRLELGDSFAGNAAETSAVLGLVEY